MKSRASLGLKKITVMSRPTLLDMHVKGAPITGFDRDLLVHQPATLLKDEVAPLCLAALSSAESAYKDTFGIRNERIRELFLEHHI